MNNIYSQDNYDNRENIYDANGDYVSEQAKATVEAPTYVPDEPATRVSPLIAMSTRELATSIITGVVVGLVTFGLMYILNNYVFGMLLCRGGSTQCSTAPFYAMVVSMIAGGLIGLAVLARIRIYRPLLVVLAATISLWSVHSLIAGLAWYWAAPVMMALFGVAYGLFAWLSRIRSFWFTLIIVLVVVVLARLVQL